VVLHIHFLHFLSTVKSVYNNYLWDNKIVANIHKWSLFRGFFSKWDLEMVVIIDWWSLVQANFMSDTRDSVFKFYLYRDLKQKGYLLES